MLNNKKHITLEKKLKSKKSNLIKKKSILPVILSGGTGSRLWPLSRSSLPKQYLSLEEKNNYTMLQNTLLRLKNIDNLLDPLIICNEEHRFIAAEQIRSINVKPKSILLEPFGRNTGPAISLASLLAEDWEKDLILLVLSADHKIKDDDKFFKSIDEGIKFANKNRIVIFGVTPSSPETGYGYIKSEEILSENLMSSKVEKFLEKPNHDIARNLIKDKHNLWNSGIFMFKASIMINELERLQPEMLSICNKSLKGSYADLDFRRIDSKAFQKCPNESIDISIIEKTDLGTVVYFECGWNDLGNWQSICDESTQDLHNNTIIGRVFAKETKNSYLRSENRLLVTAGLNNMLVIETDDAVLIADKGINQSLKDLVKELKKENFKECTSSSKMYRPWGYYETINEGVSWKVKKIEILPKASLSLQMHNHRAEHWVVVNGIAKVEINGEISILNKNQSIYVPLGSKHRLSNPGKDPLILIEVQSGNYLEEDDIIRFDDIYGR